jgi:hypothetical protein
MRAATVQQFLVTIIDKPLKARGKPVTTTYAVSATSRDEAIAYFADEVGEHHMEMAMSWSCVETQSRVVRAA